LKKDFQREGILEEVFKSVATENKGKNKCKDHFTFAMSQKSDSNVKGEVSFY